MRPKNSWLLFVMAVAVAFGLLLMAYRNHSEAERLKRRFHEMGLGTLDEPYQR